MRRFKSDRDYLINIRGYNKMKQYTVKENGHMVTVGQRYDSALLYIDGYSGLAIKLVDDETTKALVNELIEEDKRILP